MSLTLCSSNEKVRLSGDSRLVGKLSFTSNNFSVRLSSIGSIKPKATIYRDLKVSLPSNPTFIANESVDFSLKRELLEIGAGNIRGYNSCSLGSSVRTSAISNFKSSFTDKFSGYRPNFIAYEKLYPLQDISFKSKFTNRNINVYKIENNLFSPTNIYSSIDEGVFTGNYTDNGKLGSVVSDDSKSFALTFRVFASGDIQYKFRVAKPTSVAKLSYLAIRASAPFDNYAQKKPQQYKIYDIKFEDPSGNLIIQYEDISIRGDSYYTTYLSKPLVNNLLLPTWDSKYPLMDTNGFYTLTLNMSFDCNAYPFTSNFDTGYEQTCIINSNILSPNPFISLNISALEIGSSGGVGILRDNYLALSLKAQEKSQREKRTLLPTQLFTYDFDNGIYPQASSIWQSTANEIIYNNTISSDTSVLLGKIRNDDLSQYISLLDSLPVQNSGRLILKFNTKPDREAYDDYVGGAFRFGGSSQFNDANLVNYLHNDNFFDIDTLELKVIARKKSGSPDYPIDVVGYSDDKLLNITPAIGGFLQNSGAFDFDSNQMPDSSGFLSNTFGISDSSLSDQSQYFQRDIGDHYAFNNSPIVDSTTFKEYTIPLQIYQNPNKLGYTRYSISSFFENLYLDISPISSGADICNVKLNVYYKPANAIMMHVLGSPQNKNATRKNITLLPASNYNENQVNTSIKLSGILTGLSTPNYIKSNYSRRWRGNDGRIFSGGDFSTESFDFSFNHKQAINPFKTSYIDFKNVVEDNVFSSNGALAGQSDNDFNILSNFGWRYSSSQLFLGTTTPYKSIAWRNNIFDAFDRAARISSEDKFEVYNFNNDSFTNYGDSSKNFGFALFIRFTPDQVSDLLINNHLILCYENFSTWSLVLICENGELKLKVKDSNDNIVTISDSRGILDYQFPLPILITYNDDNTYKFKLYTDNELFTLFNNLRATSPSINSTKVITGATLKVGHSSTYTSLQPLPMFVHEIGISNGSCNIAEFINPYVLSNKTSISNFFSSSRMSFNDISSTNFRSNQYSYIDDDISLWKLGDFKVCQFSPDFDFFTKRNGIDFLSFDLKHHGSGYSQITNLSLPEKIITSGVSYHTQIENDFLRFNLSNIPTIDKDRFYAISPRISKTLPRGYKFNQDAICVDTIVEHETNDDIVWPNGKTGPKLIVSLYAKTQDSDQRPSKIFGLINRSTHYLEPSGCIRKLTSKFSFDDLLDNSEPWASFDVESYTKEFKEKYFSQDIDNMFLQYDLVYPSGRPFSSLIKIHSANVRIEDAIFISDNKDSQLNLYASGQKYQVGHLNLFVPENGPIIYSGIDLFVNGNGPINSNMNLFIDSSGYPCESPYLTLYTVSIGSSDSEEEVFGSMFGASPRKGLNLSISGQFMVETDLSLCIEGSGYYAQSYINLNTAVAEDIYKFDSINLNALGRLKDEDYFPYSTASLFVNGQEFPTEINNYCYLYTVSDDKNIIKNSGGMNLFTINYPISSSLANNSASIRWDQNNVGKNITVQDNSYAYIDSDDNIRGVDLVCYGVCSNNIHRCYESTVNIHGIEWYNPEVCVNGGIFRAKNTYTNLNYPSGSFRHTLVSNLFTSITTEDLIPLSTENNYDIIDETISSNVIYDPMPYSGHFYGIRKYSGLAPDLPYYVNITGKTGSTQPIDIPTEIIDVEYNKLEDDKIDIDYKGVRLLANSNYRHSGDKFGKAIASKENLLAIGSPMRSIVYNSGIGSNITLQEAGSVFLYKRQDRPVGSSWPLENYKSPWMLDDVITLPSGLMKDYFYKENITISNLPFQAVRTTWFVGQEGRQFGHSVDLSVNKNEKSLGENSRQILVVGGPSAKWTPRQFDYSEPSGVNVGLIIFTDEFKPRIPAPTLGAPYRTIGYEDVLYAIQDKDLVFHYFSNPKVKFNVKLIICQPIADSPEITVSEFPDKPSFMTLKPISRNIGYPVTTERTSKILNDIKSAFFEAFPDNNNLPPLLGLYVDNSNSLGREALEPAIDQFINFYKKYTFDNGLVDFNQIRSSGEVIEYIPDDYDAENWVDMSRLILSEVLDTGNLVKNNQVRFFAQEVGNFNESDAGFNVPPESGGKVYIFEKESGSWNLIQEIKSPNVTYEHPDRFGHSVSISDDGEVIAIGSPYINQAVTIYERKSEQRDQFYNSLIDWVENNRSEKYSKQISDYYESSNLKNRKYDLYLSLDKEDKFKSRVDLNIEEYQNIYTFNYSNMQPIGSWSFIPEAVAPTSRLGYAVDVNEDGSIVVASAPTDSLNLYNDGDVYYAHNANFRDKGFFGVSYSDNPFGQIKSSWSSSVNAGSIHVFESRKYYPHNKVIEYGRFGNLHEITSDDTPDSGHFHYLTDIFSDKNFTKTEFTDSSIPKEAGLVFIITPKEDALTVSDEVFNNIYNWLALGDRNLVLVANDPIWEGNGKYKNSNDILNKLLERLNSRMRIVPARSKYESLPEGYASFNNIVPSFVPQGSSETYVTRSSLRGSGVADIKIYYPGWYEQMPCKEVEDCSPDPAKIQIQSRCEMPLMHYGDLRAQWNESCCTNGGLLIYGHNWPLVFGSYKPQCGEDTSFEDKPSKNFEPIPLLVAAEQVDKEIIYPAVPAQYKSIPIYETISENTLYYDFGSPTSSVPTFIWDSGNVPENSVSFNITNNLSEQLFYKPSDDSILQARGIPKVKVDSYLSKEIISDKTYFGIEHTYDKTTSKVVVLSSVTGESESSLLNSAGDQNVKFYTNLVSRSISEKNRSFIAQLGGWTGRSSFKDGYENSILKSIFLQNTNSVTENVLSSSLNSTFNVVWIANIASQPSNDDLFYIKNWLSLGDRKLIITCGDSLESSKNAQDLCDKLGIDIGPLYLPYSDKYEQSSTGGFAVNELHQAGGQFFQPYKKTNIIEYFSATLQFYPLRLTSGGTPIAYVDIPVYDFAPKENVNTYWSMNPGITRFTVPVQAGSGYKVFITTSSDSPSETEPLQINIDNASIAPNLPYPDSLYNVGIIELNSDGDLFESKSINTGVIPKIVQGSATNTLDIQVTEGTNNINIYISCAIPRISPESNIIPKSVKLIGISGVPIPINQKVSISTQQIPTGRFEIVKTSDAQPEARETIQIIRPISTDNTKYCKGGCEFLGGIPIEDGPVVSAQEIEILSPFDAGVARSRITVITDSSMIQGRYVTDNGVIPIDTYSFIRSLYPETEFPYESYGRQFNVYNKLISPERGSPTKYFNQGILSGLNSNFGGFISIGSQPINQYESQYNPKYVNRPKVPWKDETEEEKISEIKNELISGFLTKQIQHASTSRFSGIIDGATYLDAPIGGGLPRLLKEKGYDYLDFDKFPSGYPGDLFGYSLCIRGNKILVGSPFSAFGTDIITPWTSGSQLHLGYDGGAGSVYMFEKSGNLSWDCIRKLRPQSLMGQLSGINAKSDQFGHSVSMQNDTLIIGSPNHIYGSYYENIYQDGAFARKNFNSQFDVPIRNVYDLGLSGNRNNFQQDGIYAKNAGSIYVYENKITDWENKQQSWKLVEKIISDSSSPSGERFGKTTYITRPYRTDADYTIFAGCDSASGNGSLNIGAVYAKDIMLKKQPPSVSNSGAWIHAKVFGEKGGQNEYIVNLRFSNSGDSIPYYSSGIVVSNSKGEIFIEVSGQDPSTKGFISHRPYIESIIGYYQYGKILENNMILFCDGQYPPPSSQMNLIIDVENSAYVYNTLGLYGSVITDAVSTYPSGLNLFIESPSGSSASSLNLYMPSGIGSLGDNLNLQVRGK